MLNIFKEGDCSACVYQFGEYCSCRYMKSVNLETGKVVWTNDVNDAELFNDQESFTLVRMGYTKVNAEDLLNVGYDKTNFNQAGCNNETSQYDSYSGLPREPERKLYTGIILKKYLVHNNQLVKQKC